MRRLLVAFRAGEFLPQYRCSFPSMDVVTPILIEVPDRRQRSRFLTTSLRAYTHCDRYGPGNEHEVQGAAVWLNFWIQSRSVNSLWSRYHLLLFIATQNLAR
jgi:hypothetical protein